MLCLPKNVASLADCCAKDTGRISMTGVQVREYQDSYQLAATDGRKLVIVRGPKLPETPGDPVLRRLEDAMEDAPSGMYQGVVPAKEWRDAFKAGKKDDRVALSMDDRDFAFAFGGHLMRGELAEGYYPAWENVLPKRQPAFTIRVNGVYLMQLLAAALPFADDSAVDVHFYGGEQPAGVSCHNEFGQFADAIIMPFIGNTVAVDRKNLEEPAAVDPGDDEDDSVDDDVDDPDGAEEELDDSAIEDEAALDTVTEEQAEAEPVVEEPVAAVATLPKPPAKKKRGRPRKTDKSPDDCGEGV